METTENNCHCDPITISDGAKCNNCRSVLCDACRGVAHCATCHGALCGLCSDKFRFRCVDCKQRVEFTLAQGEYHCAVQQYELELQAAVRNAASDLSAGLEAALKNPNQALHLAAFDLAVKDHQRAVRHLLKGAELQLMHIAEKLHTDVEQLHYRIDEAHRATCVIMLDRASQQQKKRKRDDEDAAAGAAASSE